MLEIKYNIERPELQSNGYYMTYGWLILEHDPHLDYWPVVSGKFGRGSIPLGIYQVTKPIMIGDQPENKPYKKEGNPWIAKLTPIGKCVDDQGPRTGLFLHPDGNVDGSLGCIAVSERDLSLFEMLKYLFEHYRQEVRLLVC